MQRSHACLPVRQATVALSSAHRSYAVACGPLDHNAAATEAIVYYNRAMRSLRKYLNATINNKQDVSLVIPLICSILFFCFEITQGNTYNALQHLDGGIEILNRCKKEKLPAYNNPDYGDLNILCQILARLDLQATMFDDCRRPKIRLLDGMDMTASSYKCFETIYDAQTDLTRLQHRLMHLLISNEDLKFRSFHELPEHVILEKRAIGEVFDQWSEKADQFVYEKQAAHQQDEQYTNAHDTCVNGDVQAQDVALAVLRVQHQLFHLCLAASLPYDSTVFDLQGRESSYRHTLNTVLDMAESALAQNHACGVGNRPLAAETGIVAPLFYIIMKCTDSDIVEKARKLLVASGRREGLFDSRMVVAIAERIVSQNELPEILIAPGASALEWQAGDALEKREMGLAGVAKNLGVIP
jgi:hypothetical protein